MTGRLRRVLVRSLRPRDAGRWRSRDWRSRPDHLLAAREHEAFQRLLADAGAQVDVAQSAGEANPDAIYVYDPALITATGAVLLRPGKAVRRGEVDAIAADLERLGVPIAGRLEAPSTAEGGDMFWLDERTLLVGRGYRTNDAGVSALAALLPGVDVMVFDLPHHHGPGEVLHLMSLISPLDRDLVVAYLPLLPVRLAQLLAEREIRIVEVPDDEFENMGANVLALAPRAGLALAGNRQTRRRMERAGVTVQVYRGDEISIKGDGGPTCLTRPLTRDPA